MQNYECPHCHQATISFWRRQFMGPVTPAACSNCGAKVYVPMSGVWTVFPILLVAVLSPWIDTRPLFWVLMAVAAIITMYLSSKYVPLVEKK
jgi:hypothetical protein